MADVTMSPNEWIKAWELGSGVLLAGVSWISRRRPWSPEDLNDIVSDLAKERRRITLSPASLNAQQARDRTAAVDRRAVERWLNADLMSPGMRVRAHLTASLWLALVAVAAAAGGYFWADPGSAPAARALITLSHALIGLALVRYLIGVIKFLAASCSSSRRQAYYRALDGLLRAHHFNPDGSPTAKSEPKSSGWRQFLRSLL
ncbi:hypothetical protein [Kytococcus sp. Marseille-QA3725]